MAYRLVASDLDGTLLRNDQTLSRENSAAIAEMTARGVHFAVSTGRTYGEIPDSLRKNDGIRWFICSDGGLIYDKQEDRRYTTCMEGDLLKLVLDTLFDSGCFFTAHFNGVSYYDGSRMVPEELRRNNVSPYFQQLVSQCDQPAPRDFRSFCYAMDGIEQITAFFSSDALLQRCRQTLLDTGLVETAWSNPCYMEIYHADAGKGRGLARLAQILGIDLRQTIAIGDTANDSSILQAAGLGLATDNAKAALKAIADAVICSNEEHVAAYVLDHYL